MRPTKSRYCVIWNVDTVLRFLKTLCTVKFLSFKVLILKF